MNRYLCLGVLCLAALDAPHTHAQGVWETVVAANSGGDNLSVYRKNPATGALEALGAPVTVGRFPVRAAVHPSNRFLYVSNAGTISAFHIDGVTGSLTTVTGSPFSEGGDPELASSPYAAGTNPWGMAGTNFGDIIFRDGFEGPPPVAGGEE